MLLDGRSKINSKTNRIILTYVQERSLISNLGTWRTVDIFTIYRQIQRIVL